MDAKRARKQNLLLLVARVGGKLAELERQVRQGGQEVTASYLSQIKGGRNMGDDVARKIERGLGLEEGWMDRPHNHLELVAREPDPPGHVSMREEPAEFPVRGGVVALQQLEVYASMGRGVPMPEREPVIDSIRVPLEYVKEQFPNISSPNNLKIITGYGNSMEPTYKHGDPLIVDVGVTTADVDSVYVFAWNDELYIKQLQRWSANHFRVISHNRDVADPFEVRRDEIHVIGRVVCAVNMRKIA